MNPYEAYAHAQKIVSDFLASSGAIVLYIIAMVILRVASLIVKAWGHPYAYTSYVGNGGKSPSKCRNSDAGPRQAPRLLILKH